MAVKPVRLIATLQWYHMCACWGMPETSMTLWLYGNCQGTLSVHHMQGTHHVVPHPKAQHCVARFYLVRTQQATQFGQLGSAQPCVW